MIKSWCIHPLIQLRNWWPTNLLQEVSDRIAFTHERAFKKDQTTPPLESLIAESMVLTGKEVIQRQMAKKEQLVEFAKAIEFESRNKRARS
jgi:hypothetical protein